MKKLLLLPLLLAATMLFADDAVLVENFSKVGKVTSVGNYTWTGDLGSWTITQGRRNTGDTITTANLKQAVWLPVSSNGAGKMEVTLKGGIKAVAFKYARFGKESTAGRVLQLKVTVGETENSTPAKANNEMKLGNGATAAHETYTNAFNVKKDAKLIIENVSSYTESLSTTGICRICVGDITVTPYLLYTTTEATLDLRLGSNKYTNAGLINNTDEGSVVYSISENTIGATIDAGTGEVTATSAGKVTVTATWGEIATSYELTILAKDVATAAFEKEAIRVKINAEAPTNTFTTNSDATVAYSSSVPAVATVNEATGAVTLVGVGTTVITANVPENESYTAASASYTLRVVPANFNLETFTGAHNVDLSTNNTYLTSPTESFAPSEATGLKWTTLLGSVRSALGGSTSSEIAAVVRAKKTSEENFGYILSSKISGGIDSLTFEWNANGSEASRKKNWDID
ncbi:MAG: Ig-like domain-containing protein, partial [Paludibacteraceae bacterium]|nr:Ig-like domain-containing protein [Paludibacteraceae bacterium]